MNSEASAAFARGLRQWADDIEAGRMVVEESVVTNEIKVAIGESGYCENRCTGRQNVTMTLVNIDQLRRD